MNPVLFGKYQKKSELEDLLETLKEDLRTRNLSLANLEFFLGLSAEQKTELVVFEKYETLDLCGRKVGLYRVRCSSLFPRVCFERFAKDMKQLTLTRSELNEYQKNHRVWAMHGYITVSLLSIQEYDPGEEEDKIICSYLWWSESAKFDSKWTSFEMLGECEFAPEAGFLILIPE
jgi:hypothetical protein